MSAPGSITFAPPARPRQDPPAEENATKTSLFVEPEEDIVVLGLMMNDTKIIADLLQTLPFGPVDAYRGNLRVISGAADRLRKRCAKLLGEAAV